MDTSNTASMVAPSASEQSAQQLFPPGTIAPQEVGTPKGTAGQEAIDPNDYGPNNEKLPKPLQEKLRWLVDKCREESKPARREEIRRVRQAREFWKSLQYNYWSADDERWHLPWEARSPQSSDDTDLPRYMFVTNYFQAFGLSIIAVLSQDVPRTRLWPTDPDEAADIAAAKNGSKVIELAERNNRVKEMLSDAAFYLFTDGKLGGFVRYVTDGQRFGFHPEDELGETTIKAGEDQYNCPDCGTQTPASKYMGLCQNCGGDIDDDNLEPAPLITVPIVQKVHQVPNGQEVITMVGALELKTPPYCNHQHEFGYMMWDMEVHRAKIMAAFPDSCKELGLGNMSTASQSGQGEAVYERHARMAVTNNQNMEGSDDLVTYSRCWLRPWMFYLLEAEMRTQLLQIFPIGCAVEFAGSTYCQSHNESMDDHWRVMHAMPGDGQDRNGVGTSFVSVQERINTLDNIIIETAEYGIPATFATNEAIDFENFGMSVVEPGAIYPSEKRPGERLEDGFFQTQPATASPDVMRHRAELSTSVGQFLTGAFPALFGGDTGANDTLGGIAIQRDQAMGRIGLVWRRLQQFKCDLDLLTVDVFRKNRPDDVKLAIQGKGGQYKSDWIRLADLKGNLQAFPDSDTQYPAIYSQKRAVVMQLMQSPDPMIQKVLGHPDNLEEFMMILGLEDLVVPDDESRIKQQREIDLMTQPGEEPLETMGIVQGPQGPLPMPNIVPSVPIDPQVDNHEVESEVCARWLNSEAGQEMKQENPLGFANVRAHYLAHLQVLEQRMAQQAMAAATLSGGAGAGAGAAPGPQGEEAPSIQ